MDKPESAIRGLEEVKDILSAFQDGEHEAQANQIMHRIDQALFLMKAQEAIKPYMDYDGQDVWRCGKCGNSLMHPSYYEADEDAKNFIRYCSRCGKAVKWDG